MKSMPLNILNLSFSSLDANENNSNSSTKDIQQSSFSSLGNTQKLSWSMLQRHSEQQGEKTEEEEEEKKDDGTVPTNESSDDDEDMNSTSHNSLHLSFDEAMINSSAHGPLFNNNNNLDDNGNDQEEEAPGNGAETIDRIKNSHNSSDNDYEKEGELSRSSRNSKEEENLNFTEQNWENDETSTANESLHSYFSNENDDDEHDDGLHFADQELEEEESGMNDVINCSPDPSENDCEENEDSRNSINSSRGNNDDNNADQELEEEESAMNDAINCSPDPSENDCEENEDSKNSISSCVGNNDDNDVSTFHYFPPQIEIQNMPALLAPSPIELQKRLSIDPYRVDSDSMSTGNIDYQWRNNTTESKKNGHEAYISSRDIICILDASVMVRSPEEMMWRKAYWEEKTEVEKLANALHRLDKPDYHGIFGADEFAHPLQRTAEEDQLHYCCDAMSVGGESTSHHSSRSRNRKLSSRGSHYHDDDNYSDCSSISASMRSSLSRKGTRKRRSSRMSGRSHAMRRSSTGTLSKLGVPTFIMDCVEEEEGPAPAFDTFSTSCGRSRSSRSERSAFSTFSLTSSLNILGSVLAGKKPNKLRLPSSNSYSKKRQFIDLTLADDAASNASSDLDDDEQTKCKTSIGTCLRRYSAGLLFGGLNSNSYDDESLEDIEDDMSCITNSSFSIRGHRNAHHQRVIKQWNDDTKISTSIARKFLDLTDGRGDALRGSLKSPSNSFKSGTESLDVSDNNLTEVDKDENDKAGESDDISAFECSSLSASSLAQFQHGESIRNIITTVETGDSSNENIETNNNSKSHVFSGNTEGIFNVSAMDIEVDSDDEDDYGGFIEGWENAANSALIKEAHEISYELAKDLRERGYESPYHDVNRIFPSFSSLHDRLKPRMIEHIVIEDEVAENDEVDIPSVEESDEKSEQPVAVEEKSKVEETETSKEIVFAPKDEDEDEDEDEEVETEEASKRGLKARMMEHLSKKSHLLRREKPIKMISPDKANAYLKNFFYEKRADGICALPKILGEVGLDKRLSVDTIQVAKEIIDDLTSPLRLRKPDEKVDVPGRKSVTFAMNHIISGYDEFGQRKSSKNLMQF